MLLSCLRHLFLLLPLLSIMIGTRVLCAVLTEGESTLPPCDKAAACFLRNLTLSLPHDVETEKNGFDITSEKWGGGRGEFESCI